ncbi:MAG: hypothetical protein U0871_21710 [Gemmataceae bacterium]
MVLRGTVVNGVIVPDGSPALPEGSRVWFELATDDHGPPPEPYDRETELAILRQSIAETAAGVGGVEARTLLRRLALKHDLPLEPGE